MNKNINNLGHPKDNEEMYLNYLATKSIALKDLPQPYTNKDTYLYYLCKTGGVSSPGGGGGSVSPGSVSAYDVSVDSSNLSFKVDNVQDALEFMDFNLNNLTATDIGYTATMNDVEVTNVEGALNYINLYGADTKKENEFRVRNYFEDLSLTARAPYVGDDLSYAGNETSTIKTGRRDFTSHCNGNNGFVEKIFIRVNDNLDVRQEVRLKIWEVERGETPDKDVVVGEINENEIHEVRLYNGYKILDINIQKFYIKPTYFVYQFQNATHMAYATVNKTYPEALYFGNAYNVELTNKLIVDNLTKANRVGIYWIMGNHLDIRATIEGSKPLLANMYLPKNNNIFNPFGNLFDRYIYQIPPGGTSTSPVLSRNNNYIICKIPIELGKTYTIYERGQSAGSGTVVFVDELGNTVAHLVKTPELINEGNYHRRREVVVNPSWSGATHMIISCFKGDNGNNMGDIRTGVMVFEGISVKGAINDYIPYSPTNKTIINGERVDISFDNSDTGFVSSTVVSALKEASSKDTENVFNKDNWFKNVLIRDAISKDNISYGITDDGTSGRFYGMRDQSSDNFDGYVSKIRIPISSSYTQQKIVGVEVFEVEKGEELSNDIVRKKLYNNVTLPVVSIDGEKYVDIIINKYYHVSTYFIIKTTSSKAMKNLKGYSSDVQKNIINISGIISEGSTNLSNTNTNWCAIIETLGDLSLRDKFMSKTFEIGEIKTFVIDKGNTVIIGGQTWVRYDGQDLTQVLSVSDVNSINIPRSVGYTYICIN